MTALLNGLGFGLSFWIILIPSLLLLSRRQTPQAKTAEKSNLDSVELLRQRNETSILQLRLLERIADATESQ